MSDLKVGLEVHGYLITKEKLFCNCPSARHSSKLGIKPNTFVCPICAGYPGAKPMAPNSEAIKKILQIAIILNCKINESWTWQRKHYSWPDLPKGFQTTISGPYSKEVAREGTFEGIRIRECHLEEDPAAWNPETGCIDYNRSGIPLVEIVTEPDFRSEEQVEEWIKKLLLSLSYIKAVDANAGIKADVNVSTGGERVEIKNITSIANMKKAIEHERVRQKSEKHGMETRRFDERTGKTILMRTKENAEDYRFIPEPDLPVIKINKKEIETIKENMPETPHQKLEKLIKRHKIDKKNAEILYKNLEIVEFFEEVVENIPAEFALTWITIELLRVLNWNKKRLEDVEIKTEDFVELLKAVKDGKITELKAKQTLNEFVPKSFSIKDKLRGDGRITDKKELETIITRVLEKNKNAVEDYKSGKQEALNYLMGEVMKESERRADFKAAREVLIDLIKK